VELEISGGTEELAALAKRLHAAGSAGQGIRKNIRSSIRVAAKPLGRFIAVSAGRSLPQRGGLGYHIAGATASVTGGVSAAGVSARLSLRDKGYDLKSIDRGRLRHPTFGRRGPDDWKDQTVKADTFTDAFKQGAPAIRTEIEKGLLEVARSIEKG
jgi:hypothetical protein